SRCQCMIHLEVVWHTVYGTEVNNAVCYCNSAFILNRVNTSMMVLSVNNVLKIEPGTPCEVPWSYQIHLLNQSKVVRIFYPFSLFNTTEIDQIIPFQYPIDSRY